MSRTEVINALGPHGGGGEVAAGPGAGAGAEPTADSAEAPAADSGAAATGESPAAANGAAGNAASAGPSPAAGAAGAARSAAPSAGTATGGAAAPGGPTPAGATAKAAAGTPATPAAGKSEASPGSAPVPGSPTAGTGSTVVLGNIGTYSGAPGASVGTGRRMVQVVAKWINTHGGLNGHPMRVIVADDGGDPSRSLALAKDMVENQHAIAFFSNLTEVTRAAIDPYLNQKGVPSIGVGGANSVDCASTAIFMAFPCLDVLGAGDAAFAVAAGKPKLAVIYCGEVDPCRYWRTGFHSDAAKKSGADIVYETQASLGQPDFTSECLQAQNKGAQAVALGGDASYVQRAARSCVQQGFKPLFLTASLALTADLSQDPAVDGIVSPVGSFPWMLNDLPGERDYHAALQRYDPGLVEGGTTSAVWANGALLQAAGATLPANPTPADLLAGLYANRAGNLAGLVPSSLSFTKGQPSPKTSCFFAVQLHSGTWGSPTGSKPRCL